jgi:Tol biopolymer transport system component
VAFTVLPPGSRPQADSPAELWLLDVRSRSKQRLAGDADLRIAPILARDGRSLVYRSSEPGARQSLMRVDLATGVRRPVVTIETAFGTFPVGFAADGSLVYASLSVQGTAMYRIVEGRPQVQLFTSPEITRDWRLSPDGEALAYLAPEIVAERVVNRLHIVRLDQANAEPVRTPLQSAAADHYGAAWTPDGSAITVGIEAAAGTPAGAVTLPVAGGASTSLAAPPRGFDRPLEWSPDGSALAARSFDGNSASAPGTETTVVVSTDGERRPVTGSGDIIVFGWVDAA